MQFRKMFCSYICKVLKKYVFIIITILFRFDFCFVLFCFVLFCFVLFCVVVFFCYLVLLLFLLF